MKTKIIIIFFLISFKAYPSDVFQIFKKSFEQDYHELTCSDNIWHLSQRLKNNNIDINNAFVIYLRNQNAPYLSIEPMKPRGKYLNVQWMFHTFLILNELVYDFDYSNELKPVELKTYLKTMWDQTSLKNNYVFQIKKLSHFNKSDLNGRFNEAKYPLLKLEEFLLRVTPTQ